MPTLLALALFAAWAVSEGAIHVRGLFQPEDVPRRRAGLTWLQGAYAGSLIYGLADSAWLQWSTFEEAARPLCWVGAVVVVAGLALRLLARLTLSRNFSAFVQTYQGHQLVTRGVYTRLRHPAYTGFVGLLIGFPLAFGSLGALVIALGIGVPALVYRIRLEEAALVEWFGEDYLAYQRRTDRLIPYVW